MPRICGGTENSVKIAVSYKDGEIFDHVGHSEMFALYDYTGEYVDECSKRLVECGDRHGHQAMADLLRELGADAVLCGNMGDEAKSLLLSYGIIPVAGYCGDADTAADMLVTGQLPPLEGEGGCSGGCGGCGGCHGEEGGEGEEGGCGCSGGCCQ